MKILCLADLHNSTNKSFVNREMKKWSDEYNPDIIVIAGDVHESNIQFNPYKSLAKNFRDIPVVFCLGNHEFYYRTYEETINKYKEDYRPEKWNVHCLDIIDKFDFKDFRFVGNALMYDGTMKDIPTQTMESWNQYGWMDGTIKNWTSNWKRVNQINQDKIFNNISYDLKNILVTHTVPHKDLNIHPLNNPYNAWSGVSELSSLKYFDYAICGHTHKRILKTINNCHCINVGNNYHVPFEHYLLEI